MSNLKMPSITIAFTSAAQTAANRSGRGTVAIIVRDAAATGGCTLRSAAEIPAKLTAANRAFVERALLGARSVVLYVLAADGDLADALDYMATQFFSWLCIADADEADNTAVKTWLKTQRDEYHAVYKAVLADSAADYERVVNFTTDGISVGGTELTAAQYASRIAGILAGMPLTQSATYAVLNEVQDVDRLSAAALDEAVGEGELVAFHDGGSVRLGRAVTSLTTVSEGAPESLKKIHVLEVRDAVESDLRRLIAENYIGKFLNNYTNKLVLLTAVKAYLKELEAQGVLQEGSEAELDLAAQTKWLEENGTDTSSMTEQEILEAKTGASVFLKVSLSIFDAMEDVAVTIYC